MFIKIGPLCLGWVPWRFLGGGFYLQKDILGWIRRLGVLQRFSPGQAKRHAQEQIA